MSRKKNGVNYSRTAPVRNRRANVIKMREDQLELGKKATKVEGKDIIVPLEEKDIVRIKTEIKTLKARI
jgi:hypothetical protein